MNSVAIINGGGEGCGSRKSSSTGWVVGGGLRGKRDRM